MKKIFCMIALVGMAVMATACGEDGDKTRYCDAGFHDGCEDGVYVHCEMSKKDSKGKVIESKSITFDEVEYVCDGKNVLVPSKYSCSNGKVLNKDDNSENDGICLGSGKMLRCSEDSLVESFQFCNGKSVVFCENGKLVTEGCGDGNVCEEYEKADTTYALCVKSEDVLPGCGDVTDYGKCNSSDGSLTFCTKTDASKGKTIRLDCPARGQQCRMIEEGGFGYDCTDVCGQDNAYTSHGECNGNDLIYCAVKDGNVSVETVHCGDAGCGFVDSYYDCLDKANK